MIIYIYIYIYLIAEQQKFEAACNNFTGDMLSSTWSHIYIYIYIYISLIAEQQKFEAACNNFTGDMLSSTWTPRLIICFHTNLNMHFLQQKKSFMHGYEVG